VGGWVGGLHVWVCVRGCVGVWMRACLQGDARREGESNCFVPHLIHL